MNNSALSGESARAVACQQGSFADLHADLAFGLFAPHQSCDSQVEVSDDMQEGNQEREYDDIREQLPPHNVCGIAEEPSPDRDSGG